MGKEKQKLRTFLWIPIAGLFLLPLIIIGCSFSELDEMTEFSGVFQVALICLLLLALAILGLMGWRKWLQRQQQSWDRDQEDIDRRELMDLLDKALLRRKPQEDQSTAPNSEVKLKTDLKELISLAKEQLKAAQTNTGKQQAEERLAKLLDRMEALLLSDIINAKTSDHS